MKKILSLFAICVMATAAMAQTVVEKGSGDFPYVPQTKNYTYTYNLDDNITLEIKTDGTVWGNVCFISGSYASMTVSAKEGYTITNIEYTFYYDGFGNHSPSRAWSGYDATNSTSGIVNNGKTSSTFTGNASSVVMKFGTPNEEYESWIHLTNLKVTYTAPTPAATEVNLTEDDTTYPEAAVWDESKTYDITLTRNLKANQWNTLMLPFPMTAAEVKSNFGSDLTLMKMTGIENNVVNFETVDLTTDDATAIEVSQPYIVKPTSAIEQIKVTGKTGLQSSGNSGISYFSNCVVYGVFTVFYMNSNFVKVPTTYVLSNDKFYHVDSEITMKGYRWYIQDMIINAKQSLSLSLDGEIVGDVATAISSVNNEQLTVNNGKFLQDGKLVIVKDGRQFNAAGAQIK